MKRELVFTPEAGEIFDELSKDSSKKRIFKDVLKTLAFMEIDLRHPSLNTHEYKTFKGPNGEKVFEAYAQQRTSSAYRIFWYYGPGKNQISIVTILPHAK